MSLIVQCLADGGRYVADGVGDRSDWERGPWALLCL